MAVEDIKQMFNQLIVEKLNVSEGAVMPISALKGCADRLIRGRSTRADERGVQGRNQGGSQLALLEGAKVSFNLLICDDEDQGRLKSLIAAARGPTLLQDELERNPPCFITPTPPLAFRLCYPGDAVLPHCTSTSPSRALRASRLLLLPSSRISPADCARTTWWPARVQRSLGPPHPVPSPHHKTP